MPEEKSGSAASAQVQGAVQSNNAAGSTSQKTKTKGSDIFTSLSTNEAGVLARACLQAATQQHKTILEGTQPATGQQHDTYAERIRAIAGKHGIENIGTPCDEPQKKNGAQQYVANMLKQPFTDNIKALLQDICSLVSNKKQMPLDDVNSFLEKLDDVTRKGLSEEQRQFRRDLESSVTLSSAAEERKKDADSAHRTVYAQPFSAELLCPDWHMHNEGFHKAINKGISTDFGFHVPKRETRFNDSMNVPLIKACADAAVYVKSHASFEADPAVQADYVVQMASNYFCYPLLLELKTDDSKQTQDAAKAQVLEYASRAIKSAGPKWRDLKGYLFPFAITVCNDKVSVYACTLGDEVHGREVFPSVLYTKLGNTTLSRLGHVIKWLVDKEHMALYEKVSAIAQGRLSTLEEHPNENGSDKEEAAQLESPPPPPQQQQHAQAPGTKTATGKTKPKPKTPRKQQQRQRQRQEAKGDRPVTRSVSRVSQTRGTGRSDSGKKKARPSTAQRRQQAGRSRSPTPPQRQRQRQQQHAQAAGSPTTPATVPKHTKAATKTDTADSGEEEQRHCAEAEAARERSAKVATRYEMRVYKGGKETVSVALVNGEVLKVCGGHEIGAAKEASNERKGWELVYPEETVKVHERSRPVFACPDLSKRMTGTGINGEPALEDTDADTKGHGHRQPGTRQQAGRSRSPTPPQRQRQRQQQHAQAAGSPTTPATVPKHTKAATKTDTADSGEEEQRHCAEAEAARERSAKVATRYEMRVYKGGKETVSVALVNGEVLKVCGGHEIGAAKEASNERKGWELVYPEETVKVHERSRPVFACPDLSKRMTGTGINGEPALEDTDADTKGTGIGSQEALEAAAEHLLILSKNDLCHCDIRSHNILHNGCIVDFGFLSGPKGSLPGSYSTTLRERPRRVLHGNAQTITLDLVLDWESLLFSYVFSPDSVSDSMLQLLKGKAFLLEWLDAKLAKLDKDDEKTAALLHKIMKHVARAYF
ncbi:serine/threonine protein kinase [Salpingoeca rosetta]|uniref:Serine/threonine protein kinase n=1 Tax=Salpingoeca rosetta (strain ATCC 50818 / BSB-021) TaxID=946362 RepID=F2US84_SALR5|nr:serine/threonine protein kinase [Salpingoeca rosetta]EGD80489.1 serine/threonine protein kinase [Salpingoeca rosetta]|eukprot:XP_004988053.1 serine/threonine protein kinase [Salpingoeca rosetta]